MVFPSLVSSIDAEASMTSATSRCPLASKRFRFRYFSKITDPTAAMSSAVAILRTVHREFFPPMTNDAPTRAIPVKHAGRTNHHGILESGGINGRASAKASNANKRQRAAIKSKSSHSSWRRRMKKVSVRNRIAPHWMGFAARWRKR